MNIKHPSLKNKLLKVENLKVVHHTVQVNGEDVRAKCVEFEVISDRGNWKDWAYYNEFVEANPDINLKKLIK